MCRIKRRTCRGCLDSQCEKLRDWWGGRGGRERRKVRRKRHLWEQSCPLPTVSEGLERSGRRFQWGRDRPGWQEQQSLGYFFQNFPPPSWWLQTSSHHDKGSQPCESLSLRKLVPCSFLPSCRCRTSWSLCWKFRPLCPHLLVQSRASHHLLLWTCGQLSCKPRWWMIMRTIVNKKTRTFRFLLR